MFTIPVVALWSKNNANCHLQEKVILPFLWLLLMELVMWVSLPDISCLFHAPSPASTLCVFLFPRSMWVHILPSVLVIASEAPSD